MKIAFFMHDLSGGGVERMRLALAPALTARGVAVTLIVQRRRGALVAAVPPGIDVVELGTDRTLATVPALVRALRRLRPDWLVSSLDHNNLAAVVATRLAGTGTRVAICQHNALSAEAALGWRYRLVPPLYRLLSPLADAIVAVSDGVADDLARATGIRRARVTTIFNPVVTQLPPSVGPARNADGERHLVWVGRLVPQKDPLLFVRALARARAAGIAVRATLLGQGPLAGDVARLAASLGIADAVTLAGFVADPRAAMQAADALVLTSAYEGFGNVLVEALACGTPVVAADCPHGPAEILDGGKYGVLIATGDEAGFADAFSRDLRAAFPEDALRARARRFSADACADAHLALFARHERRLFGLRPTSLSAADIAARVLASQPADAALVVTPNLNHLRLLADPAFAEAYRSAALTPIDGWPLLLLARLRGLHGARRATGCAIFAALAQDPAFRAHRVAYVVESEPTARALERWSAWRGDAAAVFTAPARLGADPVAAARLADAIATSRPDILVLTLGAPTSELFAHRHRARFAGCWVLCVGQAVRVELGLVRRAPRAIRVAGLEWAWRIAQEPRRLAGRYAADLAYLPRAFLKERRDARNATRSAGTFDGVERATSPSHA